MVALRGVVVEVLYDFTNGLHDASNIVATVVASHGLNELRFSESVTMIRLGSRKD